MEALIVTITEYWSEKGVWLSPRETAIIRWVESRLGTLHGRDKIRNALKDLVRTGILVRHSHGRYEVTYSLKAQYAWPSEPGYLDPWRSVLVEPMFHVDAGGSCWAYGKPLWRGGPRLFRLPKFPRPSEEFLTARAAFHLRNAGLNPAHPEIGILVRRAIGETVLESVRSLYGRTKERSPARQHLETRTRFHPIIHPNPDLLAWRRQQRGKNRGRWRPEDDPWPYLLDILDALDRLCGAHEPLEHGAPFRPQDVCRELDRRLREVLTGLLKEGTPADAAAADQAPKVPSWVERAGGGSA